MRRCRGPFLPPVREHRIEDIEDRQIGTSRCFEFVICSNMQMRSKEARTLI
ncbi:unnamed protein product [Prunus brigantina]